MPAPEPIIRRKTEDVFFIHNAFGSFFSGVLNWFGDEFYTRFNYRVIGTYDKAVEFFNKKKQGGGTTTKNPVPSITLDPMLDFSPDERGGRFLWQYSRYAPGLGMRMFKSIDLKEQCIEVSPVFTRYQGTFEIIFWLSSVYELLDFRTSLLQFMGGYGRWVRPEFFWTHLILPEEIENFEKEDGEKIDWGNTLADIIHVHTINKHRLAVPYALDGWWKLDSFGDASTKYGGDNIAEHKLSATFTYEINLPTYVVLNTQVDGRLVLNLSLGKTFSQYPLISPFQILKATEQVDETKQFLGQDFNIWIIKDSILERSELLIEFPSETASFPTKPLQWNQIACGKLLEINDAFLEQDEPLNIVSKDTIVFFDSYRPEFLPAMRRAYGVISFNDTLVSELYAKCEVLQKPLITFVNLEDQNTIRQQAGNRVTMDPLTKRFYTGELESEIASADSRVAYDIVEKIKTENPEIYQEALDMSAAKNDKPEGYMPIHRGSVRLDNLDKKLITDHADGIQTRFPLSFLLDEASLPGIQIYVDDCLLDQGTEYNIIDLQIIEFTTAPVEGAVIHIGGELMVIKESKLIAFYEFTEEDLENIGQDIVVDLPVVIDRQENLILASYSGKLVFGTDYDVDLEAQTVTIFLKPVPDEIVQLFSYVEEN